MENVYLEKIASKWARRVAETNVGKQMGFTRGMPGVGGPASLSADRVTNATLLNQLSQKGYMAQNTKASRVFANQGITPPLSRSNLGERFNILDGGEFQATSRTANNPHVSTEVGRTANTATRTSGDILAKGGNNRILAMQEAKRSGIKPMIGKAKSLALAHPGKAALGVGALAGLGYMAMNRKPAQQEYAYPQYYGQ